MMVDKVAKEFRLIRLEPNGFSLSSISGTTLRCFWKNVTDVQWQAKSIRVTMANGKQLDLHQEFHDWFVFIQNIPPGFPSFHYQGVEELMTSLKGCAICGMLAVNGKRCYSCGTTEWAHAPEKEYVSETEYIIREQLDYFDPEMEDGMLNISNEAKNGFQPDPSWQPLIKPEDFKK